MGTTIREQRYPTQTEASWHPVTLSNGTVQAIAGKAGAQIFVYAVVLSAAMSINVTFENGSTPFSGAMPMTGLALDLNEKPMICSTGNDFNIVSTGSGAGMVFASIS